MVKIEKGTKMKERIFKIVKNTVAHITALAGVIMILYIAFFGAVMNDSFLKDINIKIGIHEKLGMSEEDLGKVAQSMVYFTKGESDTLQVRVTMWGTERDFYNEKEILHIEDVRDLVRSVRIFVAGCGVVCILGTIILACRKELLKLAYAYLNSLVIVAAAAAAIGLFAVEDMQAVINGFHYLFFDNDLWLMDGRKDMVVWLFTEEMYGSAIVRIGIWLGVLLVPFAGLSVWKIKKEKSYEKNGNAE